EYRLPFAERGLQESLREIQHDPYFSEVREEILTMIWDMEEEIMGRV
ncbi:MAG: ABC transporter ATP-binding protein, partial [Boseongicola sp. SB0667_bin_21]|nr:ABC transporter ATP-binding protein [Boseongicola sp. SB0667_bin_21]